MATVTGLTADRMFIIENESVISGNVQGNNLILVQRGGTQINAGNVRGPTGATGPQGTPGTNGTNGKDGVIQSVNDVSAASVYSPRIFANKAAIDAWATAPLGATALATDSAIVWQKDSVGWFMIGSERIFASTTERDSRWANAPDGAMCQAPLGIQYRKSGGTWYKTQLNYTRAYGAVGTPNINWPVKTLSGRYSANTDVNGYWDADMTTIWAEAGISPIPTNLINAAVWAINAAVSIYQFNIAMSLNTIRMRFLDPAGTIKGNTAFNVLMTVWFQNGAI